jgi:hypothetical protein
MKHTGNSKYILTAMIAIAASIVLTPWKPAIGFAGIPAASGEASAGAPSTANPLSKSADAVPAGRPVVYASHSPMRDENFNHALQELAWMTVIASPFSAVNAARKEAEYKGKEKILIPHKSWPCGMAEGIPVPERGARVFEASMKLDQTYDVGKTPYGQRNVFIIQEGTVSGEKINGSVMAGGLDFQLSFPGGGMEIEEIFVLRTSDGKYIYLRSAGTAMDPSDVRIVPDFEAPNASGYSWLNTGKYAGRRTLDLAAKTMKISVFDISSVAMAPDSKNSIPVTKPADVQAQPWDFRKAAAGEKKGDLLISENVTLGPSQSVGATKKGNRNIIPITGGTITGKITGKVLSGGADYQNLANPATIDARYLWQTSDGEVIIVRNAGAFGSLVPFFEVRVGSQYEYLNKGLYLSSNPGMGAGGVGLTFYMSQP